jgi:hypothetical protein
MTDNNNISDDQLSQFLAFTGSSDPNIARQYLEMSGNQLEMAVSLFMDHNNNNGGGSGMVGGGDAGGITHPQVRAPDATRSMRLVGGPPSPGGGSGGHHPADAAAAAALMAAVGGPNAAQMMMMGGGMMGGMNMNNHDQQDAMEDIMASTWASRDLRETVNRAAAAAAAASSSSSRGRNRRNRHGSSGGNNNNNNNNNDQSSRRRRTGSRSHSSSSGNNHHRNNNNDEVQVLDEDGNVVGEVMEESDEDSYNYNDQSDDDDSMGGGAEPILPTSSNRQHNHPPSLSTMFQAPNHLIHRAGGFLGAKNFAKDARRWLLVNIQTEDDFACHALNRDVWHDELVENLIREGFVFWQIHSTTPEGLTYCQRYKVEGYPHIAILDPRTGSLLYRKEGWTQVNPLTAEQFVEIASDFCSRHSFDKLPMPARHGYASNGSGGGFGMGGGGGGGGESSRLAKRPVHELSEQEQLEAAIRASMQDASGGEQQQHSDDDDDEVQILEKNDIVGKSQEEDTTTTTTKSNNGGDDNDDSNNTNINNTNNNNDDEDESKLSPFEKEILSMTVPPEPTSSTCRVQFRMPDGKRLIRKFDGTDPVKVIYAFVAQQLLLVGDDNGVLEYKPFELKAKFPPVDLMTFVEESISSCGLSGEAITFLWK